MVSRDLVETEMWRRDPMYWKVYTLLLFKATHQGNQSYRNLPIGVCTVTESELASDLEYTDNNRVRTPSRKTVRKVLDDLHDMGIIKKEAWAKRFTRVTICDYETYNSANGQLGTTNGTSNGPSEGTLLNNGKNENHVKNTHRVSIIPKSDVIEGVPIPEGVDDNEVRELTDNYFKSKMNGATPSKPDYGAVRTLLGLGWPRGKIERLFKILPGYAQYHWDRPAAIMGCKRNSSLRIYEILEPHIPSEDDDLPF